MHPFFVVASKPQSENIPHRIASVHYALMRLHPRTLVKPKLKNHKQKYSATEIKNNMNEELGMDSTYSLCWRAKEKAVEELRGKPSTS